MQKETVAANRKGNTFIITYFADDFQRSGKAQAFRFREGQLFILSWEDDRGRAKCRWMPAICCKCEDILNVDVTQEIMMRSKITLMDLHVIEDFGLKFAKAKVESKNSV